MGLGVRNLPPRPGRASRIPTTLAATRMGSSERRDTPPALFTHVEGVP
jgi:hypothetical protein